MNCKRWGITLGGFLAASQAMAGICFCGKPTA